MVLKLIKREAEKIAKRIMNDLINPLLDTIIVKPLKAVLKKLGWYKFIAWIDKIVGFILDILKFFLDMIGILADLLDFGVKFIEVLFEIASKLAYYAARPFEFIVVLLNLVFLMATFSVAFVYHKFTFPNNVKVVEFFIYALSSILLTVVFGILTVYWAVYRLVVEYVVLHGIDRWLKGYLSSFIYRYFSACENPPDNWYMTPGAHVGNKSSKNIFAYTPCPLGTNVKGNRFSLFCEKNDRYDLDMCPQANLYRAYLKMKPIGKIGNSKLSVDRDFMKLNSIKKKNFIEEYDETINRNINSCDEYNKRKSTLIQSICTKQSKHSPTSDPLINKLCHDTYCSRNINGFCHKLSSPGQYKYAEDSSKTDKFSLTLNLMIGITIITLIVGRQDRFFAGNVDA